MPPRRSHRKSRAGCRRCKARKIKCDEVHPRCGNCLKHGVPCDFEHPDVIEEIQQAVIGAPLKRDKVNVPKAGTLGSPVPTTPVTPSAAFSPGPSSVDDQSSVARHASPAARLDTMRISRSPSTPTISLDANPRRRMLELRLMHHYTSVTYKTFTFNAPLAEDIWRVTVPALAFSGSKHLADAVLAIAALHLRSLSPDDRDLIWASHEYMAASLADYNATLNKGIDQSNAESLFLTSALIAFQATATRTFSKDEPVVSDAADGPGGSGEHDGRASGYEIPFAWFHSCQGVKAITAASWRHLRHSKVVTHIINSQTPLQLDFGSNKQSFFGHLLEGLEDELAAMDDQRSSSGDSHGSATSRQQSQLEQPQPSPHTQPAWSGQGDRAAEPPLVSSTRQAYQHAVAALNWAHRNPHRGAALSFPATVSRRFVELLEERRPRALVVLACFFALLKSLEDVWWLRGTARREVLGVVGLFSSGFFGPGAYDKWWPHLEWAARVALYQDGSAIPPGVWGVDLAAEKEALAKAGGDFDFVSQIELLSQMTGPTASLSLGTLPGPS